MLVLDKRVQEIPAEKKVEILWDVIRLHGEGKLDPEDVLFFKRIAFRLNIDKSLVDFMLQ